MEGNEMKRRPSGVLKVRKVGDGDARCEVQVRGLGAKKEKGKERLEERSADYTEPMEGRLVHDGCKAVSAKTSVWVPWPGGRKQNDWLTALRLAYQSYTDSLWNFEKV
ncbi:hypothetical protein RRG08_034366 [Elysia crispata]|uniref:Uncharacterized protein n=1 Tax=Elysia crispata TaxID=231223 RepID=A0AAE0YD53_9GAST|nr:hypothetical protein RRG08_034366 [Elysia crispata]